MNNWILTENSSNINKISFDLKTQELLVNFKPNNTYAYKNIPYYIWEGFITSESKGKYFHSFIKSKFDYEKITETDNQKEILNGD